MNNSPQQRFCTNCGQPLSPGAAFCVSCGLPVNAPSTNTPGMPGMSGTSGPQAQVQAGMKSAVPPYAQAPMRPEEDPLLLGLAAAEIARAGRSSRARRRSRSRSRFSGCGCLLLLLILALLATPFVGFALTTGRLHTIFLYVAGGMIVFVFLLILIIMLATRSGRETLAEAGIEGCLEAIFGGFPGG